MNTAITNLTSATPSSGPTAETSSPPSRLQIWQERLKLVIVVLFCLYVGILVAAFPWIPAWTQNGFVMSHPTLRAFISRDFVRGAVSGLGIVDIWIGVWEAVRYHDPR